MKKLDLRDPAIQPRDVVIENLTAVKQHFPEAWTDGKLDFDALKELLGDVVEGRPEKYDLSWFGKREARQLAAAPSIGTLRPCPDQSVDWDTTQNLMIEGDNLEVLKLLRKSYAGRVKMIYIDPPYNTGNDFIYPDDYRDSIANYMRLVGAADADGVPTSQAETAGRFHTAWLNMIYPRLRVARDFLRADGVIFISIDDAEAANLRLVCNEIFGESNFLASFVRRRRMATGMRDNPVSPDHEYVIAYAKNLAAVTLYGTARNEADFTLVDAKSRYRSTDLTIGMTRAMRPNQFYAIRNPRTGIEYSPTVQRVWRFEPNTMARQIELDNIIWPDDDPSSRMERPRFKTRFEPDSAEAKTNPVSTWIDTKTRATAAIDDDDVVSISAGLNQEATKEVRDLLGEQLLEYPKPVSLIKALCALASRNDDIVLDFFAGSGTTGHAIWSLNSADGGKRRFILVQLPEPTGRADFPTIASITAERLRRARNAMIVANPQRARDTGFRLFRLASSNLRVWQPQTTDLEQLLLESVNHIQPGRTDDDILCELIIRLGLDLSFQVERKMLAGKMVWSVGGGALIACLTEAIGRDDADMLAEGIAAWRGLMPRDGETMCVFRDSAFADDAVKANVTAILAQRGVVNVRSI